MNKEPLQSLLRGPNFGEWFTARRSRISSQERRIADTNAKTQEQKTIQKIEQGASLAKLLERTKELHAQDQKFHEAHYTPAINKYVDDIRNQRNIKKKTRRSGVKLPLMVMQDLLQAEISFPTSEVFKLNQQKQDLFTELRQHPDYRMDDIANQVSNLMPKNTSLDNEFSITKAFDTSKVTIFPSGKEVSSMKAKQIMKSEELIKDEQAEVDREMLNRIRQAGIQLGMFRH